MVVVTILTAQWAYLFYRVSVGGVWGNVEYLGRISRATYDALGASAGETALIADATAQETTQTTVKTSLGFTGYAQI